MNRIYKAFSLLFILLLLVGCQPVGFNFKLSGTSTYSTPTPSWGVQTKDADYFRPILFKKEDLNWEVGTYREMMAGLDIDIEFAEKKISAEDVMGAIIEVSPRVWSPRRGYTGGGFLSASQEVMLYADEATAILVGELEKDRRVRIGIVGTQNTTSQLNIVVESCWGASTPEIGEYQNCNFWGQHGRYITLAHMTVDGEILTMDDWVVLIDVIQDKLIAQVERENAVEDDLK